MKTKLVLFLSLALVFLFGGCRPDDGVWWSPDGQTAAVRSPNGLRLSSGEGQLSELILTGEVVAAEWLTDGSGLLVSRVIRFREWRQVEGLLPTEEATRARALADSIPDLLKAVLVASGGSLEKAEERFIKPLGITNPDSLESAFEIAASLHKEKILQVLGGFPNARELEAELFKEVDGITVHEITLVQVKNGHAKSEPKSIVISLRKLGRPALSPRYPLVAFEVGEGLKVAALDGTRAVLIADDRAHWAEWSADGRQLYYVVMGESEHTGELRARAVVSEQGKLLEENALPNAETLLIACFNPPVRFSVLPDGRILFAGVPISLPAAVKGVSPAGRFVLFDPKNPAVAPELVRITKGSLPDDLSAFAVSPDGRFVAVVESGTDTVALLELGTGEVNIISPAHSGWKGRLIPAWKNNRELSFAAPVANGVRPELVLWQRGTDPQILSKGWPADVVGPWLEGGSQ